MFRESDQAVLQNEDFANYKYSASPKQFSRTKCPAWLSMSLIFWIVFRTMSEGRYKIESLNLLQFSMKTYCGGTHWNHRVEVILLSTHNLSVWRNMENYP